MDRPGSMGVREKGNGFFQSDSFASGKKNIHWLGEKRSQIWTAIMFRYKVQISDLRFGQLYFTFIYFDTL